MKNIISISISAMTALAISFTGWKSYQIRYAQILNQKFCQMRSDIIELNSIAIKPSEDVRKNPLVSTVYQAEVGRNIDQKVQNSLRPWKAFKSKLDISNQAELSKLQSETVGADEISSVQLCQSSPSESWLELLPNQFFGDVPGSLVLDPIETKAWLEKLDALRAKIPIVEGQLRADTKIICATALDLRRTQKIEAFYVHKCPKCKKNREFQKVNLLSQKHKSHLQQNLAQFRMKWTDVETQKLECLKGLLDEPTNLNESSTKANSTFSNQLQRSGFSN